jgi:hypothetical protein
MSRIVIDGASYLFERASFVAYHCAGKIADWNRIVTTYPVDTSNPSATRLSFALARSTAGVALSCRFDFDHDPALDSFPGRPRRLQASIDIDATVAALHPGRLPAGR